MNGSVNYDGHIGPGPFGPACGISQTLSQTTEIRIGTGECCPAGWATTNHFGNSTVRLADEDTEDDAEKRAPVTPGNGNIVYRSIRTTGFTFSASETHLYAKFKTCPGDYTITLLYTETPQNGPPSGIKRVVIDQKRTESGEFEVDKEFKVGTAPCSEKGVQYAILGVEAQGSCNAGNAGDSGQEMHSISYWLNLGRTAGNASAGQLRIDTSSLTADVYSPTTLLLSTSQPTTVVEPVRDAAGVLRQVKVPQALVDIVVLDATSYEARFYTPDQVGTQNATTKIYALSGSPYVTYKFENPDTTPGTVARLRITENRSSLSKVVEYRFDASTSTWALSKGNGLRQESEITTTDSNGDRVKTRTISDDLGHIASKVSRTYHIFPWGEELVREVLDPESAALATDYLYYDTVPTSDPNYRRLKQVTRPNGAWELYTYDSSGRALKTYRPFLDTAAGTTNEALCRVAEVSYDPISDADGDGQAETCITTVERIQGQEVSRQYRIDWTAPVTFGGETCKRRSDIQCVAAGAAWNAAANLVTETLSYASGPFTDRVRRVVNASGTTSLSIYSLDANGQMTTTVRQGQPNAAAGAIVMGTRTVTTISSVGQTVSESVTDIASNLLLSSWTASTFDGLGRPTRIDYNDGTYITRSYACCGLDSERDRFGTVTAYTYDALGRQTSVTRAGLTQVSTYDADGRVESVTRVGTDNSEIIQEASAYDLAGRQTSRIDARNRQTGLNEVYNPTTNHLIRTTTAPDGGTRIETYARDGSLVSVSGTAAAPVNYEYGVDGDGVFTKEIRVGSSGELTEWIKSYTDFAGRPYKTVYADGASTQSFYNALGQLAKTVDQDGVTTLFAYNTLGEQEVVALDLNRNGVIDYDGTDRITKTVTQITTAHGTTVRQGVTSVWEADGSNTPTVVSTVESSADGRSSWSTVHGLTTTSQVTYPAPGVRQEMTTTPDGVQAIRQYNNDRLATNTVLHPSLGTLASASYSYDAFGRLQATTDARMATTTYTYYDDDQIKTVTTPDPDTTRSGPGYDPQTTAYTYDSAGRLWQTTLPDATVTTQEYYLTGQLKKSTGSRTYPQLYTYDAQGRLKTLTTWQDYIGDTGKAVTTWNYDPVRGWLTSKKYADNTGPSYVYYVSGRLKTRTWARGSVTTYTYNNGGDLASIAYSDTTPSVTLTYDRRGRLLTTTDAAGVLTRSYDPSGALQNEGYGTTGLLANLSVNRTFDSLDRLSTLVIGQWSLVIPPTVYGYDPASRLQTVTSGSNAAAYSYLPNTSLLQTTTFTQGGATRLTTTKVYDLLNRLTSVTNTPTASTASVASYAYNAANQRNKLTREDGAYWDYGYDALGQLTSGKKKLSSGELLGGYDFGYAYDDIGNRKTTTTNGWSAAYTATFLNQYTQRTVPGSVDVTGAAATDATVTVNLQPTQRQGERFYRSIPINNTTAPQNTTLTIVGVKTNAGPSGEDVVSQATKTAFTAQTPESFTYDLDGNLTADARWTYTWDAENRLISMTTQPSAVTAGLPKQKLEFTYDAMGRRIQKTVSSWNLALGTWNLDRDLRFIYDGWNLLADFLALGTSNLSLQCNYVWGQDLSGSFQGAGGVGGLLLTVKAGSTYATGYDGNGNVQTLINLADGSTSADFEYDPFGNTIKATGAAANVCPFGFSTKYSDFETGLLYYGFRYYQPSTGRWMSRDPVGEMGGKNLYSFVNNNGVSRIDRLGLVGESGTLVDIPDLPGIPGPEPGIPGTPDGPEWPPEVGVSPGFFTGVGLFLATASEAGAGEDAALRQMRIRESQYELIKKQYPKERRREINAMRIQLQENGANGKHLWPVEGKTNEGDAFWTPDLGVQVWQIGQLTSLMRRDVLDGRTKFPKSQYPELNEALAKFMKKVSAIPPYGVIQGGEVRSARTEFGSKGCEYRIDLQNLRGHNLRF